MSRFRPHPDLSWSTFFLPAGKGRIALALSLLTALLLILTPNFSANAEALIGDNGEIDGPSYNVKPDPGSDTEGGVNVIDPNPSPPPPEPNGMICVDHISYCAEAGCQNIYLSSQWGSRRLSRFLCTANVGKCVTSEDPESNCVHTEKATWGSESRCAVFRMFRLKDCKASEDGADENFPLGSCITCW